jgi:hypothetical protein
MEDTMMGKLLSFVAATALLVSIGAANAKEPLKLTEVQLDKVTAGADTNVRSRIRTFVNQDNSGGGVLLFSPQTAVVTPTLTPTVISLFNAQ